jgi:hypothetical protein
MSSNSLQSKSYAFYHYSLCHRQKRALPKTRLRINPFEVSTMQSAVEPFIKQSSITLPFSRGTERQDNQQVSAVYYPRLNGKGVTG